MELHRIDLDRPGHLLDGYYAAYVAGDDERPEPPRSRPRFAWMITRGWAGYPHEAWAAVADGEVVGGYALEFPEDENPHLAELLALTVHPAHRRRGVGRALIAHVHERARANGRGAVLTWARAEGATAGFAKALGFDQTYASVRRLLDLRTAGWDRYRELAAVRVPGYELEYWDGPARGARLDDLTALMQGMNDAPQAEGVDKPDWGRERVAFAEEALGPCRQRSLVVVARRLADGVPAGFTRIYVDEDGEPAWGLQADTTVLREHRGRRLGVLLKAANLVRLRRDAPSVERLVTWNAASNAPMVAVNDELGYRPLDAWGQWTAQSAT
ncbi:GNAT family N-acetyltransferase [Nonomuraea sp. NPDC050328]|uniref:GNAT family N-acetyltransferase n=1 Tax=Nonomuraea sp. NPDC050328 TaxID=3364361 RepID=UPI00378BBCE0